MNRPWIAALIVMASIGVSGVGRASEPLQPAQARILADTVKPGQWEFTSQMQLPGASQLPPGAKLPPGVPIPAGGGMKSTYKACVDAEKAVPSDPRGACKIDQVQRNGATVAWTGTCASGQGAVHSEGVAHYSGETMEANLTTHVAGANGQTVKTTQHITGRYLGACAR